jgi:hypothetical protein
MRVLAGTRASGSRDFPVGRDTKRTSMPRVSSGTKGWTTRRPAGCPPERREELRERLARGGLPRDVGDLECGMAVRKKRSNSPPPNPLTPTMPIFMTTYY